MTSPDSTHDLVIRGATVYDGTGAEGRVMDVAIDDDRITAVGQIRGMGGREVSAAGLALAPGFIDVHTHDDWALLLRPDLSFKTLQGVTSVVTGNCGSAPSPVNDMTPGLGSFARMRDYFADLEGSGVAVNVAALAGHGAIRSAVMGTRTNRHSDAGERAAMARVVEEALEDGVIGMSTGLAYEPGKYAAPEEIAELAGLVAAAGGIYTSHIRNEAEGLLSSIEETIDVGRATGVKVQISHLKATNEGNWGRVRDALAAIEAAQRDGIDVMADQYPYTRGSTLLEQVVRGGRIGEPSAFGTLTGDKVLIAAAPRRHDWEGRTLADIAAEHGVTSADMADHIVAELGRSCFVVLDTMSEDDVRFVMAHPSVMIGSDGIAAGDKPHPRLGHTFPRVLGTYARDLGVLSLADAVHRMTGLSAQRFGLRDRGEIRPGAFADLVLFDAATIVDTGTYSEPLSTPTGITEVWVNGRTVVRDGEVVDARPGRVVRL